MGLELLGGTQMKCLEDSGDSMLKCQDLPSIALYFGMQKDGIGPLEPIRQLDTVNEGIQVSTFMEQVVEDESQMECLPQNCSRITICIFMLNHHFPIPLNGF